MTHHLRGTSIALAENVFISGGKGHRNYGRGLGVSTLVRNQTQPPLRRLRSKVVPRVLSRNYNAPRSAVSTRLFSPLTALVGCRPSDVRWRFRCREHPR